MKKLLFFVHCSLFIVHCSLSHAATPAYMQSTSTDWEGLSGLRFREYKIKFKGAAAAQTGWEMYYLDAFPCYGVADSVRAWVSAKSAEGAIRIACIRTPRSARFAYRPAKKDAPKGKMSGILSCKIGEGMELGLSECERTEWSDFEKSDF